VRFKFELAKPGLTEIKVYDLMGKELFTVFNGYLQEGEHEKNYSFEFQESGIYLVWLISGEYFDTKMLILSK